jgi:hypothetical protein
MAGLATKQSANNCCYTTATQRPQLARLVGLIR